MDFTHLSITQRPELYSLQSTTSSRLKTSDRDLYDKEDNVIRASPYPDILLNTNNLDTAHIDIARRLTTLSPLTDHLDRPYPDAFNFNQCLASFITEVRLYVVVFRSTLAKKAVSTDLFDTLHRQDRLSYIEANNQIGGLLKYWFGSIDSGRRNMATCIWVDQDHAREASKLSQHQKAIEMVRHGVYQDWRIERYHLYLGSGARFEAF